MQWGIIFLVVFCFGCLFGGVLVTIVAAKENYYLEGMVTKLEKELSTMKELQKKGKQIDQEHVTGSE
ncbi:hypothetical protein [Hespellia stercorisuis]|uniref:Uncharacterized protein n=1 Tax=Hespellia stercorisuis DSM 15480 TaxID=1121950 RepID=A0A1M6XAI0_9FIRM|nr:hypothetical protein [Hespellia stercorisuis]SHL02956.1 hypothetical protein SAMN02745243_04182 [Hespellia stercorisuis DSM 15480]